MVLDTKYSEAIARIKDKLDIVQVISEYVILKKAGRNYQGLCPFHKEKTPSFSVNPQKQIFKCFGCGAAGDAIAFLMKINNQEFSEVISDLAQKFGIELPQFKGGGGNSAELKQRLLDANKFAAEFFNKSLKSNQQAEKARNYLKSRDITDEVIAEYLLGFAPNQPYELMNYLKKEHKFTDEILEQAGLVVKRSNGAFIDRFRNRLMIPVMDDTGNIVGFGARALDEGQNPKYLNSPDTILYNKSKVMFGLDKAKETIRQEDAVIIMEGYFDVISAQTYGIKNVVATSGTSLTQGHLKNLSRFMNERKIYLAFDSDKAGRLATQRGAEVVKEAFEGLGEIKQHDESFSRNGDFSCEIRVVVPPEGKDPDEFIKNNGAEAYMEFIKNAPLLIDFEIDSIIKKGDENLSPQEKAKKIKGVVRLLSEINNKIIQTEYIKSVAKLLDVSRLAIQAELESYGSDNKPLKTKDDPIVTKSLNKLEKAHKKLLSVYFISEEMMNFQVLNNYLEEVEFIEEPLASIKKYLEEISLKVNNSEELQEQVLNQFTGQLKAQEDIIEISGYSNEIKDLSAPLLRQYVEETINFIKRQRSNLTQNELKSRYYKANSDEMGALQIQYEVRDKLKKLVD